MKRFSNILFVAESDADDPAAFGQAVTLANNNQASLTLIDVVDLVPAKLRVGITPGVTPEELCDIAVTEKREKLDQIIRTIADEKIAVEAKVLVGKPFIEIIREVLRHRRDLVIKSVDKTEGIGPQLFGGTDMKLLRKCPCPVWLSKSTQLQGYREILVGLDYEPENAENDALNRQILEMATSFALADFSELHIVHAWCLQYESFLRSPRLGCSDAEVDAMVQEEENKRRRWLTDIVDKCCAAQGQETAGYLKPQLHLVKGDARNVVPKCAQELGAELVIVGTVGRTGIPGFIMGNTAEAILNQIDCSVLAIKPAGFVSPVTPEA